MPIQIVKTKITQKELVRLAKETFGDMVKAVVDVEQGIMAIGGELHADAEILLVEQEHAERENTWGINIYPEKSGKERIEFNSMVNIKPSFGNRSRGVEDPKTQEKIRTIMGKLIAS